jgi:hypothetical protein
MAEADQSSAGLSLALIDTYLTESESSLERRKSEGGARVGAICALWKGPISE